MRHLLLSAFLLMSFISFGQIYTPVKWTFDLKPSGNGEYLFTAKAKIDQGWWVYSQHLESEDGPIATTLSFDDSPAFKLLGKNKESDNVHKIHDKVFDMNVSKFQDYFTIEQKIKVVDASKPVSGSLNFMTCNDERCLPPTDVDFSLKVTGGSTGDASPKAANDAKSLTSVDKKPASEDLEKKKLTDQPSTSSSNTSPPSSGFATVAVTNSVPANSPGILAPVKWTFRSEK
ncbi:MAG: protein-disulfide reductase DsbD domain-containing protein, partial [Saprospiraceae bacterium]